MLFYERPSAPPPHLQILLFPPPAEDDRSPNKEILTVTTTKADAPESELEVLRRSIRLLSDRLPARWTARTLEEISNRADALVEITAPDGRTATLVLEAKRVVEGRDVFRLRDQLTAYVGALPNAQGVVAARYLSSSVRERLIEAGLSFVDATGNLRVEVASPGLFLSDRGADRDPWRGPGRPRGTLKGEPAAKVVRALADFNRSWRMRELIDVAQVSTGAAYRVLDFLEREDLVARDAESQFAATDWARLLRRWSNDYGFLPSNAVSRWIAPRGLPRLRETLASTANETRYVVTGSLAAAEWAPYAPARTALIYVDDADRVAAKWDLRPADAGTNVLLAEPSYDVVFERPTTNTEGLTLAAPAQVAVDLMSGPGRNPSEAEELLRWMQANESSWRR